jgi:hypothetical protein
VLTDEDEKNGDDREANERHYISAGNNAIVDLQNVNGLTKARILINRLKKIAVRNAGQNQSKRLLGTGS